MIAVADLRKENEEIKDLCQVLSILIKDTSLMNNSVVCELLTKFVAKVDSHLEHEQRSMYGDLLKSKDATANKVASQFISNTHEMKKICSHYGKQWCGGSQEKKTGAYDSFISDTNEIFRLVGERIEMETDKVFPLLQH